jgi:hypothetical protein
MKIALPASKPLCRGMITAIRHEGEKSYHDDMITAKIRCLSWYDNCYTTPRYDDLLLRAMRALPYPTCVGPAARPPILRYHA